MEATTPELGPVGFWSPKSSSFNRADYTRGGGGSLAPPMREVVPHNPAVT